MTTEVTAAPVGELRAASTAAGGTALTTTAALITIPDGAKHIFITPRNFATAVVAQFVLNPYLIVLRTTDNLATVTDESQDAQDGSASTDVTLSDQDTAANGDYLYIGSHLPFRGVTIDVDSANANASVLTVNYWNGTAWTDITATDGTISAGKTLAVDGNVTWTVPSTWTKASLHSIASPVLGSAVVHSNNPLYWTRWQVSAALSATVTLNSILPLNRATSYSEWLSGQAYEARIRKGPGGVSCVEALVNAGTANLIVNVASASDEYGIL